MYVEISQKGGGEPNRNSLISQARSGLLKCGIIKRTDRFPVVQVLPIKYAYVIYDLDRVPATNTIFKFLNSQRIFSIGRYGEWKYSFMEAAILDGKAAAEKIGKTKDV